MNAAKQAVWLFFILITLAGSGWYFSGSSDKNRLDEKTLATTADTIVKGLTVRQYDTEGKLANLLESPEMHHIPDNNTNLLYSPHIVIAQVNQPAWDIQSQKARSIQGGEQITFLGKVIIHQDKGERVQESTMRTDSLDYFPHKKFAATSLAVIFEQPGSIVQAIGMNAYLDEKRVELLGKARATYVPSHA